MRRLSPDLLLAVVALSASLGHSAPAFGASFFQPLGHLPEEPHSHATGVSADGLVVVGGSFRPCSGEGDPCLNDAFRWTADGGMVSIGQGVAEGVSADGSVVVGGSYGNSTGQAFRWTANDGMLNIGSGVAAGVSGDGSVVVGTGGNVQAFRWTSGAGRVDLGDNPGGSFYTSANSASWDGSVIVGFSYGNGPSEAFRWTASDGMLGIGGYNAFGVSGDGSVVVGQRPFNEAFRWTSDAGMVGLGYLPDFFASVATGVSADGSVVVGYGYGLSNEAFVWDSANGMRSIPDVLAALGIPMAGWSNTAAFAVAYDGIHTTIVGAGTNPSGFQEAWLARVPEPSPGWLIGMALASLIALHRRNCTLPRRSGA